MNNKFIILLLLTLFKILQTAIKFLLVESYKYSFRN